MGGTKRFLFEVRPDLFPQGFLTKVEIALWLRYMEYLQENKEQKKHGDICIT